MTNLLRCYVAETSKFICYSRPIWTSLRRRRFVKIHSSFSTNLRRRRFVEIGRRRMMNLRRRSDVMCLLGQDRVKVTWPNLHFISRILLYWPANENHMPTCYQKRYVVALAIVESRFNWSWVDKNLNIFRKFSRNYWIMFAMFVRRKGAKAFQIP